MTTIEKIQHKDLAKLKAEGTSSTDNSVLYYYKLNKKLGFVNQAGTAVTESLTVTLWYYRVPISGEEMSSSVEPIVDTRWDNALCYGACFDLTGDPKWLALFDKELARMRTLQLAENDRTYQIPANKEYN